MSFKPMLCPVEKVDLSTIKYPILASMKLDGIRCIFHPEFGMVSRSLKPIPNKQLQQKFKPILDHAKQFNLIIDGEIFSPNRTFQEIQRACMTEDFTDETTIKKLKKELPADEDVSLYIVSLLYQMQYHCFDVINLHQMQGEKIPFKNRNVVAKQICDDIHNSGATGIITHIFQAPVNSQEEIELLFHTALENHYEGLILKNPDGHYKFGRGTIKEGLCYKVKPFVEKSGIIKEVIQATLVSEDAEKTVNELGYSVTSKKKDDRVLIERASAFVIDYEGQDLRITIAATNEEKDHIWENRNDYIGKEVCYKSMEVGQKEGGLPRHPTTTKFWLRDE